MAKDTLLDIVQDILSDADGDNVNSISDTIESDQCARVIRAEFLNIADNMDLEHHKTITQLNATTAATPAVMTRPEGFYNFEWIHYDKKLTAGGDPNFGPVYYMPSDQFIRMVMSITASDSIVDQQTVNSIVLNCYNDRAPQYYTFLDGYDSVIFDAYDSNLETNLQASKSLAYGTQRPTLALTDAAIPDLPQNQMTLLKDRSRAMFFDLFKDGVTSEIDRKRRNSEVRSQRQRHIAAQNRRKDQRRTPDYGRK